MACNNLGKLTFETIKILLQQKPCHRQETNAWPEEDLLFGRLLLCVKCATVLIVARKEQFLTIYDTPPRGVGFFFRL